MSSKYMLEQLHRHTRDGYQVTVAESLMNDTIRLTYQARPDGLIVGWYVEGPGMSFPLKFRDERKARDYIRRRWNLEPHTKRWGEP